MQRVVFLLVGSSFFALGGSGLFFWVTHWNWILSLIFIPIGLVMLAGGLYTFGEAFRGADSWPLSAWHGEKLGRPAPKRSAS